MQVSDSKACIVYTNLFLGLVLLMLLHTLLLSILFYIAFFQHITGFLFSISEMIVVPKKNFLLRMLLITPFINLTFSPFSLSFELFSSLPKLTEIFWDAGFYLCKPNYLILSFLSEKGSLNVCQR